MANQPKKLTDPTDEAMTAIQQVLSATDEPVDTRAGSTARPQTPREPAAAQFVRIGAFAGKGPVRGSGAPHLRRRAAGPVRRQ